MSASFGQAQYSRNSPVSSSNERMLGTGGSTLRVHSAATMSFLLLRSLISASGGGTMSSSINSTCVHGFCVLISSAISQFLDQCTTEEETGGPGKSVQ